MRKRAPSHRRLVCLRWFSGAASAGWRLGTPTPFVISGTFAGSVAATAPTKALRAATWTRPPPLPSRQRPLLRRTQTQGLRSAAPLPRLAQAMAPAATVLALTHAPAFSAAGSTFWCDWPLGMAPWGARTIPLHPSAVGSLIPLGVGIFGSANRRQIPAKTSPTCKSGNTSRPGVGLGRVRPNQQGFCKPGKSASPPQVCVSGALPLSLHDDLCRPGRRRLLRVSHAGHLRPHCAHLLGRLCRPPPLSRVSRDLGDASQCRRRRWSSAAAGTGGGRCSSEAWQDAGCNGCLNVSCGSRLIYIYIL